MGGIVRTVFGGSKSTDKSLSENQAYGTLLGALKGNIDLGNSGMGTLSGLLGLGSGEESSKAFNNYLDSSGYKFLLDSGTSAIAGNHGARGLFRSGQTGQRMHEFAQDLASTKLDNYIGHLTKLGDYGLQSAGIIGNAGQRSESSGKSTSHGGIFNSLFPKGLSDRRLKTNIVKLGEDTDGLGVYEFEYTEYPGIRYVGVMADEVHRLRPHADGPKKDGYYTVRYDRIPPVKGFPAWGRVEEAA